VTTRSGDEVKGTRMNRRNVLGLFLLASTMSLAWAAGEIELSAESVSVSDDATTTTYIGDVNLRVPADMQFEIKSAKRRTEGPAEILEGDVQIVVAGLVIRTQRATLTKDGATLIRMDEAVVTEARGR
jgi:lipopolysaccharide assembly outer membrane protein LptD (OstA)